MSVSHTRHRIDGESCCLRDSSSDLRSRDRDRARVGGRAGCRPTECNVPRGEQRRRPGRASGGVAGEAIAARCGRVVMTHGSVVGGFGPKVRSKHGAVYPRSSRR